MQTHHKDPTQLPPAQQIYQSPAYPPYPSPRSYSSSALADSAQDPTQYAPYYPAMQQPFGLQYPLLSPPDHSFNGYNYPSHPTTYMPTPPWQSQPHLAYPPFNQAPPPTHLALPTNQQGQPCCPLGITYSPDPATNTFASQCANPADLFSASPTYSADDNGQLHLQGSSYHAGIANELISPSTSAESLSVLRPAYTNEHTGETVLELETSRKRPPDPHTRPATFDAIHTASASLPRSSREWSKDENGSDSNSEHGVPDDEDNGEDGDGAQEAHSALESQTVGSIHMRWEDKTADGRKRSRAMQACEKCRLRKAKVR
jgi:hypothetical protein